MFCLRSRCLEAWNLECNMKWNVKFAGYISRITNLDNNTGQQNLTFFGTQGKISNPNRTFNAEFKYVSSFSASPMVSFCDSQVKCERNVYIYILHKLFTLPKMWGLLIPFCAWHLEHPSSSSNNSQKAFLHSSVPVTSFPRQKCLGGNVPRVRHWQHQDCQGRNPGGSPRNVSWGTYYTPYLGMTVTVHPQFHGSWGLYDFLNNFSQHF